MRVAKTCFLALAFLSIASSAMAQTQVYETAQGTGVVRSVLVSTNPTQIDVSSRSFNGEWNRFALELFNDDSTSTAWCSFSALVTTATVIGQQPNYGRRLSPRASWSLAIPQAIELWCKSDFAAGIWLVLTQIH